MPKMSVTMLRRFWVAQARRFVITIDGAEAAWLRYGETVILNVTPGIHLVGASIDWHRGETVMEVDTGDVALNIEYVPKMRQMLVPLDTAFEFTAN